MSMETIGRLNLTERIRQLANYFSIEYKNYIKRRNNTAFKNAKKLESRAFGINVNEKEKVNFIRASLAEYRNAFDYELNTVKNKKDLPRIEKLIDAMAQLSSMISTPMKLEKMHDELVSEYIALADKCRKVSNSERISVSFYHMYLMVAAQIKEDKIRQIEKMKKSELNLNLAEEHLQLSKIYENACRLSVALMELEKTIAIYQKEGTNPQIFVNLIAKRDSLKEKIRKSNLM